MASANSAEQTLRRILSVAPDNDAARERLSILLLKTGRPDASMYHVRYLSKNAASPKLRTDAAGMVRRFEGPTWGWRPIFSVVPSSNVNKGATGDTIYIGDQPFTIDEDSRAKNGVGLTFGAAVWKNWRPNEVWRGVWSGELSGTIYPDSDLEPRQSLATTLSFDRRINEHRLGFGLTFDAHAEEGNLQRRRITPFVTGTYTVSSDRHLTARLSWSDVRYPSERFRNGPTTRLILGWRETLSERTRLHFSLPLATERTDRAHLDNDSVGASVRLDRLWGKDGAIRTSFGLSHTVDSYLGAFPGASVRRKDRVTGLSLEFSNKNMDVKGFVPTLRYQYMVSKSNVSLYDYDSHDVLVTFQKSF